MQSCIVYIGTWILTVLFAYLERITVKRHKKIWVAVIVVLLTAICGFRGISVGRDSFGYAYNYEHQILDWYEVGFKCFQQFLFQINHNYTFFFIVTAFLTLFLFIVRFYDFKERGAAFYWSLCLFYATSYYVGFNGMRQWLAVAITFFATRYLYNDEGPKIFPYAVLNLIAISIHNSAVVMLGFLVPIVFTKSKETKIKLLRLFCIVAIGLSVYVGLDLMAGRNYGKLLDVGEYQFGYMSIVKIIVVLLAIIQFRAEKPNESECLRTNTGNVFISYKGMLLIEWLYVGLSSLAYWFDVLSRIAWYLEPFETLFFAHLFTKRKNSAYLLAARVLIIIIAIAKFMGYFSVTEMRFPYRFFWQTSSLIKL